MRAPTAPHTRTLLSLPWAIVFAVLGGGLLVGASPPLNLWPLAFVSIGFALVAAVGRRLGSAVLIGLIYGAAYFFPHISWAAVFLGPIPWTALSTLMALWVALGTGLIALAYRWVPRVWPSALARLTLLPAIVAGLWTAREGVSAVWPYGGFSWGRVAFTQSDSPLAQLFGWVGVSGVSFLMVFLVALGIEAARELRVDGMRRAVAVGAVAVVLVALPAWPTPTHGTVRVGAVQGDGKTGYFDPPANAGDNLRSQVTATLPILDKKLDVIVWPEGGSDLDPVRDAYAAQVYDELSSAAGAPLIAGTVAARGKEYFNESQKWVAGRGVVDYYDKKHPVPFGEYVPDRAFWRQFAPDLIDLIQREYTPGTTDAVIRVTKRAVAGIAICFDIVDDQLMRDSVEQGATVVFAQTNNADFGRTEESVQQLAIARIRAMELGRSVVNISTVGTSAVVLPTGQLTHELKWYTPAAIVDDVPLATGITPAVLLGRQLEWLVWGVGLIGLIVAGIRRNALGRRLG